MPFIFDFTPIPKEDLYTVDIRPNGWVSPITIEYTVAQVNMYDTMISVVWRVKGTTHCFTIPEQRLNHISHGDYAKHFTKALEAFRTDYLSWFSDDEYKDCTWKEDYRKQFGRFIKEGSRNIGESK